MKLTELESTNLLDKKTLSLKQLSKKHNVPVDILKKELLRGIKVEFEHTNRKEVAREIALDHLGELPDYYTRLKTVEESTETMSDHESAQSSKTDRRSECSKVSIFLTKEFGLLDKEILRILHNKIADFNPNQHHLSKSEIVDISESELKRWIIFGQLLSAYTTNNAHLVKSILDLIDKIAKVKVEFDPEHFTFHIHPINKFTKGL